MITTNGYQVGIHYTNVENFNHIKYTPGVNLIGESTMEKRRLKASKETEFQYANALSLEMREDLLNNENYISLYCDPGKGNLLCIGTGEAKETHWVLAKPEVKSGPILNYTALQKRHETGQNRNATEYKVMLSKRTERTYGAILGLIGGLDHLSNMSIDDRNPLLETKIPDNELTYKTILEPIGGFDGLESNPERETLLKTVVPGVLQTYKTILESVGGVDGASKKSAELTTFVKYLTARVRDGELLDTFFSKSSHRRRRHRVKLGEKSSEDKLCSRISKKFNPDGKKTIIMFAGDWGKNPNIKNQTPTSGIGLRRRIAKRFQTYLVNEKFTSSICPCCQKADLIHPKSRTVRNRNGEETTREIHHLLRCNNEKCNRWWQRDVMAVSNFKIQVQYGLKYGETNPVFALEYKANKDKQDKKRKTSGDSSGNSRKKTNQAELNSVPQAEESDLQSTEAGS